MRVKIIHLLLFSVIVFTGAIYAQDEDRVLAEVNGSKLTYNYLIDQFPEEYRSQITQEQVVRLVENWIETELLYQEALKHNIQKDRRIINMIEQQRKEIIAARYADLSLDINTEFTPAQVDSYYNANIDRYIAQESMYRLSHVVLSSKGSADAVYDRLIAGDDFLAIVQDYSEDEISRRNNGDLGILIESGLEPVVINALRSATEGGYTKPIKSESGYYHIFWVRKKIAEGTHIQLEDIRVEVEESMRAEQQQVVFEDVVNKLKSSASIKRNSLNGLFNK